MMAGCYECRACECMLSNKISKGVWTASLLHFSASKRGVHRLCLCSLLNQQVMESLMLVPSSSCLASITVEFSFVSEIGALLCPPSRQSTKWPVQSFGRTVTFSEHPVILYLHHKIDTVQTEHVPNAIYVACSCVASSRAAVIPKTNLYCKMHIDLFTKPLEQIFSFNKKDKLKTMPVLARVFSFQKCHSEMKTWPTIPS